MKCWVCKRQAWDTATPTTVTVSAIPGAIPSTGCSARSRCQNAFHALYGNWLRARKVASTSREVAMIDPSDVELAAMRQCLKAFGEAAGEIGFTKPLGDYSEAEGAAGDRRHRHLLDRRNGRAPRGEQVPAGARHGATPDPRPECCQPVRGSGGRPAWEEPKGKKP